MWANQARGQFRPLIGLAVRQALELWGLDAISDSDRNDDKAAESCYRDYDKTK